MNKARKYLCALLLLVSITVVTSCGTFYAEETDDTSTKGQDSLYSHQEAEAIVEELPEYSGAPYVVVDDNQPDFSEDELQENSYEEYSKLDKLGRCGPAKANIGEDLMPTEERESISQIKPSGWNNKEYEEVDGGYLYNRCHLIGYQLTAENANEENLITGTRYMNTEGMLPFENLIAEYIRETENHVLYEVTPVFEEENLVASGVLMEAESVEDKGKGISFSIYVYNVQPGIEIDYATGESREAKPEKSETGKTKSGAEKTYILNTNTMKFHDPDCKSADDIKSSNLKEYSGKREKLIKEGYSPCGRCRP